jgi:hypothetical protein
VPADLNHHAAKELEPLATNNRLSPAAVALYVLFALSFSHASRRCAVCPFRPKKNNWCQFIFSEKLN